MTHVAKLSINGDPNIGLYGVATDRFCLLGKSVHPDQAKEIGAALHVPVIQVNVYGTPLVGIFIAATSDVVLVPDVIFDWELEDLRQKMKGIAEVKTLHTDHTALGNNILSNDKVGFVSTVFSVKDIEGIKQAFGIAIERTDLARFDTPGSAGVLTNKGGIFLPDLSDREIKHTEKLLGFEIGLGTVNMGSPIVRSGVIANSHGFIVGSLSSGFEIGRVEESLGFLK